MIRLLALLAALVLLPGLAARAADTAPTPAGALAGLPMDSDFVFMSRVKGEFPAQSYLELPKAGPVDGRITLWTASVLPADQSVGGHVGFLMLRPNSFDCDKRLHRWESSVVLDTDNAIIDRPTASGWQAVESRSITEYALKLACGEAAPSGERLAGLAGVRADAARRPFS